MNLTEKEKIEIDFWKLAPEENPDVFSIPNLINKFKEADIFLDKISGYAKEFSEARTVLELGGGQCWSAAMLKHYHPINLIFASDISTHAVASAHLWERTFQVKLDKIFAAKSYEIPLPDESVDLVYCFASAHHFVKHNATFRELHRILKEDGSILYFHEPICKKYMHSKAKRRANKKRPVVPEDVLVYSELLRSGKENGFNGKVCFAPNIKNRNPFGTIYYWGLNQLPFLQYLLPCTGDFIFKKIKETS